MGAVFSQIKKIIEKNLPILNSDEKAGLILQDGVRIVSRRAPTLGSILSPSVVECPSREHTWLQYKGCFKCGTPRCGMCKYLIQGNEVTSCVTKKKFCIKQYLNCNTRHVVYVMTCNSCHIQYVGCTTRMFKERMREHLGGMRSERSTGNFSNPAKHFRDVHGGDMSDLSIMGVERVPKPFRGGDHKKRLLLREARWIFNMHTRNPSGLNDRYDISLLI